MPSSVNDKNIVIVGGGSTGSCAVIALAQAFAALPPPRGTTLHLFDPEGFGNGGIAYGKSGRALLNETADAMSPWNLGAFVEWADDHGYGDDPKAFHERRVFGRFLHDECEQARRILRAVGVKIIEHREAVTTLTRNPGGDFTVAGPLSAVTNVARRNIILASGYGKSEAFKSLDVYTGQGYIPSLYPPQALENEAALKKDNAKILVIGTGPALYDALRLLPTDFHGSITAISPSGAVPGRRDVAVEGGEVRWWTLTAEYRRAASAETLGALIERDLAQAETRGSTVRRTALDIQRELPALLHQLEAPEQKKFVRGSLSKLFHAATPVPDVSWQQKRRLEAEGRLQILKGCVKPEDVTHNGDGFTVNVGDRVQRFDAIINCAGHDPLNQPLVKLLVQNGLAVADPGLHLLKTTDNYHLIGSGLACIGPATHIGLHGVESFWGPVAETAGSIAAALSIAPEAAADVSRWPVPASAPPLQPRPSLP